MRKSAFTLIEILVVVSIVALLGALIFPVFGRAKEGAHETSCESNLKQVDLALQLYRTEWDGQDNGTAAQMGLPMYVMDSTASLKCSSNPHPENWPYVMFWQGYVVSDPQGIWLGLVSKYGMASPMVVDANHNDPDIPMFSPYFKRFGIVLYLNDSVHKLSRAGDVQSPYTWVLDKQGDQ
jgi:prepilin-type N-terminal cleavage/methylation domain-containing protein